MLGEPDLLFVYGTLRPSFGGEGSSLVRHVKVEGQATASGLLYDLGSFPGMIRGEGIVHGEVLRIVNHADLESFDRYEECDGPRPLFRRERVEILLADGAHTLAWVYLYVRSVEGALLIEHGDYVAWTRQR